MPQPIGSNSKHIRTPPAEEIKNEDTKASSLAKTKLSTSPERHGVLRLFKTKKQHPESTKEEEEEEVSKPSTSPEHRSLFNFFKPKKSHEVKAEQSSSASELPGLAAFKSEELENTSSLSIFNNAKRPASQYGKSSNEKSSRRSFSAPQIAPKEPSPYDFLAPLPKETLWKKNPKLVHKPEKEVSLLYEQLINLHPDITKKSEKTYYFEKEDFGKYPIENIDASQVIRSLDSLAKCSFEDRYRRLKVNGVGFCPLKSKGGNSPNISTPELFYRYLIEHDTPMIALQASTFNAFHPVDKKLRQLLPLLYRSLGEQENNVPKLAFYTESVNKYEYTYDSEAKTFKSVRKNYLYITLPPSLGIDQYIGRIAYSYEISGSYDEVEYPVAFELGKIEFDSRASDELILDVLKKISFWGEDPLEKGGKMEEDR